MTPSARLYALGAMLCATMLIFVRVASSVGGTAYLVVLAIAAILYLAAVREFIRTPKYPRRVVYVCLLIGTVWQIPFFLVKPGAQDDVLRYVWDGRLQRLGYNPYTAIPSDPALAKLHTDETRQMNNPDVPSLYPAAAELFFRAVTAIHESAFAFKVAFAGCDLLIILLLLIELRPLGQEHWVLAYAWHPLIVTCVAYNGHVDIFGVLLLLVSATALQRRRRTVASVAFGLAVAVKFLPAVLAPLYWRRIRLVDGLLAVLVVALLYVPFLSRGPLPFGSIGTFLERFRFNDPVFAIIERVVRPQLGTGFAVGCGFITAIWLRRKYPLSSPEAWAWPLAASLVCAPVVYPWYLLWLLPFLRSASTLPLMVWSLSILSVFFVWHWHMLGHPWQVPGWMLMLEFGLVAIAAIVRIKYRNLTMFGRKALAE